MKKKITEDVKRFLESLFTPCEAMAFLPTGVRLAAGANFYYTGDTGETD